MAIGPIVLRETPREFVGRVSATLNPLISAGSIVGRLSAGFLYGTVLSDFEAEPLGVRFGPLDTIFTAVGILWLLAALYARVNVRGRAARI